MKNKYNGLNDKEVINNQKLYGLNIINNNYKNKYIEMFKNPLLILLILTIILYVILKQYKNGIILGMLTIIVLVIEIYQKNKINKFECKLKETDPLYTVIRNSKKVIIKNENITVNDILILHGGDRVPADVIILESNNLKVNEKNLTNNDISIKKSIDLIDKNAKYKSNYLYTGSVITNGYAVTKVINIGNKTEYSKIKNQNNNFIQLKINKINKIINISSIIILIIISSLISFKTNNLIVGLIVGFTSTFSLLPLNLTLLTSVFITSKKYKFYENNAIIKDLSIINKLSSITYLCIDKEKFITKGKLEIKNTYTALNIIDYIEKLLLAKENKKDNQIENAIIEYGNILGIQNIDENYELIKTYPFTNESKMNANVYKKNDEYYIYIKGSLESLFDICNLNVEEKYELHNLQKRLSKKGYEIVASGSKKISKIEKDIFDYRVNFDGLITLQDNINENVKENIEKLKNNGIKIIMFSKDNKEISSAVGKQIELCNYKNTMNRKILNEINDDELKATIKNIGIFCNIDPKNKLRVIENLKNNNEFVCVTGYEANDIECLTKADISVSMCNNISKNIADITIINDNFDVFVNTIKESKIINNNIKRTVKLLKILYIIIILFALIISMINPTFPLAPYIIILKIIINIYLIIKNQM